jgi:hypothetical protein
VAQCRRLLGAPEAVPPLTKKISDPLLPHGNGRIYHPRDRGGLGVSAASTSLPYGQRGLAQLGSVDRGVVTTDDPRRIEHVHPATWLRHW